MIRMTSRFHPLPTASLVAWAISICAILGCSTATHQREKDQARRNWNQVRAKIKHQLAKQQFQAGHIESAITSTRESLGLDPENPDCHVTLILALLETGELAQAQRALMVTTGLKLESPDLAYTRGIIAERSGHIEDAVSAYGRACELDPGRVEFVIAQAECLVALDRAEQARQLVVENLERFDRDGTLDALFAEICLVLGDPATALEAFGQAMLLLDDNADVAEEFGLLLARHGRFAEVVSVLRPLSERSDVDLSGAVLRALAGAYLETDTPQRATDLLEPWLDDHPQDVAAWLLLARSALARNDPAAAFRQTQAAIRTQPDNLDAHLLHAYACWRRGQHHQAADSLRQILALKPDDVLAQNLLNRVLSDVDDTSNDAPPTS